MTGTEMIDMLGLRVEDPDEASFTQSTKIKAINIAQKTVVNLIDNAYLEELEEVDSAVVDSDTGIDENGLTSEAISYTSAGITPIRNGIVAVECYDLTGSAESTAGAGDGTYALSSVGFTNMINAKDVKRLENSYLSGSADNVVSYVFNETITVKSSSTVDAVDVWYLKQPVDLDASAPISGENIVAGDGSLEEECQLNIALHEIVVDLAESQLWKMDNKGERAGLAQSGAMGQIKALNDRYQIEKPKGIGTQGRA